MSAKQQKSRAYRLRFTDAERADPELSPHIRKAEKAADKLDAAQAKIPKKKVLRKQRVFDEAKAKPKTRLYFEEIDKPKPPSKFSHAVLSAPALEAHRQIGKVEHENVGVEAAHKSEVAAESGVRAVRSIHRSHALKAHRTAATLEKKADRANISALYQKTLRENPQLSSNPLSRWQQKQVIKRQYAAAKRAGQTAGTAKKTAERTAKAAKKTAEAVQKTAAFAARHWKPILIVLGVAVAVMLIMSAASSFMMLFQAGVPSVVISTYPSTDEAMLGAEAAYAAIENELQHEIDNYETLHSRYDEYRYDLDEIKHDPYVLISILTAWHGGEWTLEEVRDTLDMLFEKQYQLTETVEVEVRYRTETRTGAYSYTDPETGETVTEEYEYEVEVPYNYYICNVTLHNENLSHLPLYIMSEEKVGMYAIYMSTLGNRPDLFAGYPSASTLVEYPKYDIPEEYLADETFAAIIEEAEKYLGYPYVWGGSNPTTSFDCSGFVSWVLTNSGVLNTGRLGAQGLYNICTPVSAANARPGDLVFFVGTYDTPGVSHVGIYVGDGIMIHAGNPIHYSSINTSYYREHFYAFGRLPL